MRVSVAVEQTMHFVGRVTTLLMELTLASAVILSGLFVGHQLNVWRDWYWGWYLHPTEAPVPAAEVTTEP